MHPVSDVSNQFEDNVNVTNGLNNPSGFVLHALARRNPHKPLRAEVALVT